MLPPEAVKQAVDAEIAAGGGSEPIQAQSRLPDSLDAALPRAARASGPIARGEGVGPATFTPAVGAPPADPPLIAVSGWGSSNFGKFVVGGAVAPALHGGSAPGQVAGTMWLHKTFRIAAKPRPRAASKRRESTGGAAGGSRARRQSAGRASGAGPAGTGDVSAPAASAAAGGAGKVLQAARRYLARPARQAAGLPAGAAGAKFVLASSLQAVGAASGRGGGARRSASGRAAGRVSAAIQDDDDEEDEDDDEDGRSRGARSSSSSAVALPDGALAMVKKGVGCRARTEARCLKQCLQVLHDLGQGQGVATTFAEAVDPVQFECPQYWNVIRHPLDLSRVTARLQAGVYSRWLASDVTGRGDEEELAETAEGEGPGPASRPPGSGGEDDTGAGGSHEGGSSGATGWLSEEQEDALRRADDALGAAHRAWARSGGSGSAPVPRGVGAVADAVSELLHEPGLRPSSIRPLGNMREADRRAAGAQLRKPGPRTDDDEEDPMPQHCWEARPGGGVPALLSGRRPPELEQAAPAGPDGQPLPPRLFEPRGMRAQGSPAPPAPPLPAATMPVPAPADGGLGVGGSGAPASGAGASNGSAPLLQMPLPTPDRS